MLNMCNNEIHIKIGGDHGGGSFKMSYQIANVANPNSKDNTTVFSLFEAKDYRINLKSGLTRFSDQIKELQLIKWRYTVLSLSQNFDFYMVREKILFSFTFQNSSVSSKFVSSKYVHEKNYKNVEKYVKIPMKVN